MKPSLIIVIILFAVSLASQSAAQSLESCIDIEDTSERLACYDRLAGRLPAAPAKETGKTHNTVDPASPRADVIVPAAPAVKQSPRTVEPTPDAEAIFGLERKQKSEEKLPDELRLKWSKKKRGALGKWTITLENGQVWRQTDSRRFYFVNSEQWVVISRGMLGSFFMGEPDRSGGIRVERVK